jgi:predicted lipoprotein
MQAALAAAGLALALLAWSLLAPRARAAAGADPLTRKLLAEIGESIILANYRRFASEAGDLEAAARALESRPEEERVAGLREAWRNARRAWKLCEAHFIGPEAKRVLEAKIDTTAIRPEKIEEIAAGSQPLDAARVEELGSGVKGFAALEYLLFDGEAPAGSAWKRLASGPGAGRRRRLLGALAENLAATAREVRDGWEPEKGNYLAEFRRGRPEHDAPFPEKVSLDDLINQLIAHVEVIGDLRLGRPLGIRASPRGEPDASLLESRASARSLDDLLDSLEGVAVIYRGTPAGNVGLSARVRAASPEIHGAIEAALEKAAAGLRAIPSPLSEAVAAQHPAAQDAVVSLGELHSRLAVDLASIYQTRVIVINFDGD